MPADLDGFAPPPGALRHFRVVACGRHVLYRMKVDFTTPAKYHPLQAVMPPPPLMLPAAAVHTNPAPRRSWPRSPIVSCSGWPIETLSTTNPWLFPTRSIPRSPASSPASAGMIFVSPEYPMRCARRTPAPISKGPWPTSLTAVPAGCHRSAWMELRTFFSATAPPAKPT